MGRDETNNGKRFYSTNLEAKNSFKNFTSWENDVNVEYMKILINEIIHEEIYISAYEWQSGWNDIKNNSYE